MWRKLLIFLAGVGTVCCLAYYNPTAGSWKTLPGTNTTAVFDQEEKIITLSADVSREAVTNIAAAVIASGIATNVVFGDYGGGTPPFTPATDTLATDTSNGSLWRYFGGAWH